MIGAFLPNVPGWRDGEFNPKGDGTKGSTWPHILLLSPDSIFNCSTKGEYSKSSNLLPSAES